MDGLGQDGLQRLIDVFTEEALFRIPRLKTHLSKACQESLLQERNEGRSKGWAEGKAEWEAVGKSAGLRQLLRCQLQQKFGLLPDWVAKQLLCADEQTLVRWGDHLFMAQSFEDLFGMAERDQ
ncbi:hypothetical protein ACQZV8_09340 [Magnetococcales bacterium HHB-1]